MKTQKKLILLTAICSLLVSCSLSGNSSSVNNSTSYSSAEEISSNTSAESDNSINTSSTSQEGDDIEDIIDSGSDVDFDNLSIQNSPILHAWDWKIEDVKTHLKSISDAGFKAIQLSPLHPSKSQNGDHSWWNLYQPLGFKVATGNENPLGDKTKLTALTKEAAKYDIKIVMDVVTNHLAGSASSFDGNVRNYESEIYNNDLMRHNGEVPQSAYTSGDREKITQYAIGLPDLKTETTTVQNRVISMLKEYIDCGVKGFRFDAAKHIETPDDNGSFKSNYWPNIYKAVNEYGVKKYNEEPFIYGEILDNPGNISWEAYTKYMSVTESSQGDKIRNGIKNNNASEAAYSNYKNGKAEKAVLWAESHDTFANNNDQQTRTLSTDIIDLTYAIQISRKDATALYFARPSNASANGFDDKQVMAPGDGYKNKLIAAANKFHLDFLGGSEQLGNYDCYLINVRKTNNNEGAIIAKLGSSNSSEVNIPHLSEGTYTDILGNKTYQVKNGKVTLSFTNNCVILEKDPNAKKESVSGLPKVSVTSDKDTFADKATITVTAEDATISYYQINNGKKVAFNKTTTFEIGEGIIEGDFTIKVAAKNDVGGKVSTLTVSKYINVNRDVALLNVPDEENILAWIWKSSENGKWIDLDKISSARGFNIPNNEDMVIFVAFPKGITAANADWLKKIKQTDNLLASNKIFIYDELNWK